MDDGYRYTRIGDLWHCNECDEGLIGYWAVFKHDWLNHVWEGRRVRGLIDRIRGAPHTDTDP